ncbi:ScbA/BarX family gamma-butyrolactone biosynthesis protein [Patulibacter sp. SYSU D01012]|uniref:ScbA/BarX family gamma-butyrolactone biosynthesis protein n=1 Tax=Patulibacter sp. SYSU D01012 TaxID=2817381 RepID=UPI001B315AB8|nr:ScbA/BarX family gamma-butyrolactone biosynthesis protein [Patulibacter sp. SYSU D01012]
MTTSLVPPPSPRAALRFDTTVERALVHRAAVCEVFLTDAAELAPRRYLTAAQLPRVHSLYSDGLLTPARYDPLLLLEVCRQTTILVAHRFLGVAPRDKFVFGTGDFRVLDPEALLVGPDPGHAVVEATVVDEHLRRGERDGVTYELVLSVDGRPAFALEMAIRWMPPAAWDALRARGRAALRLGPDHAPDPTRPVHPNEVGRTLPGNVVLAESRPSPDGLHARVIVDRAHPALFDHELDHIPGMLLFEAVRQAAVVAAHEHLGLSPSRLALSRARVTFTRFGEFELPTALHVRPPALRDGPAGPVAATSLEVTQDGVPIATADVELATACRLGGAPDGAPVQADGGLAR